MILTENSNMQTPEHTFGEHSMETKAVSITGKEIVCFPRSGQTHTERYPTGIFYIARVDEKKNPGGALRLRVLTIYMEQN